MTVYTLTREYKDNYNHSYISTDVYSSREAAEKAMKEAVDADINEEEEGAVLDVYPPSEDGMYIELDNDEWIEYSIRETELK